MRVATERERLESEGCYQERKRGFGGQKERNKTGRKVDGYGGKEGKEPAEKLRERQRASQAKEAAKEGKLRWPLKSRFTTAPFQPSIATSRSSPKVSP